MKMEWMTGENCDAEYGVDFFYGDEGMSEGDEISLVKKVDSLFPDRSTDVGAAESYHIIYPNEGETVEDVQRLIFEKMSTIAIYGGKSTDDSWSLA